MFEYTMKADGLAAMRQKIVQDLGAPPGADEAVPMADRYIIADRVIAAVQAVMVTVKDHIDAAEEIFKPTPCPLGGEPHESIKLLSLQGTLFAQLTSLFDDLLAQMTQMALGGMDLKKMLREVFGDDVSVHVMSGEQLRAMMEAEDKTKQ